LVVDFEASYVIIGEPKANSPRADPSLVPSPAPDPKVVLPAIALTLLVLHS